MLGACQLATCTRVPTGAASLPVEASSCSKAQGMSMRRVLVSASSGIRALSRSVDHGGPGLGEGRSMIVKKMLPPPVAPLPLAGWLETPKEERHSPWWVLSSVTGAKVVIREPKHVPKGDPCSVPLCGLPASRHEKRKRTKRYYGDRTGQGRRRYERQKEEQFAEPLVGIDGEGQDTDCIHCHQDKDDGGDGRFRLCPARDLKEVCRFGHIYTYLSAVNEEGEKLGSVEDRNGMPTMIALRFLMSLADKGIKRVFAYSFGYDLAMLLKDLPDEKLYDLVRPEERAYTIQTKQGGSRTQHKPIDWQGYRFDFMRRRFDVQRVVWNGKFSQRTGPRLTVWDVFQFFQGKFVKALVDWKIGAETAVAEIGRMKEQRDAFAKADFGEVKAYCDHECKLLAQLVRELSNAHDRAGLRLRVFYGAGSTSSALLKKMGVRSYMAEPPSDMQRAVACAFFGGRFELSRIGPVRRKVWGHDIASAYPYITSQLPCLVHGRWKRVVGKSLDARIRSARLALVHVTSPHKSGPTSWGPLPFRLPDGSIVFPLRFDGAWCWRDEFIAAKDTLWHGIRATEAWCYDSDCDCRPFGTLPETYIERLRLGKDGAGLALKLGMNGTYGKCAQSIGAAPFRSLTWAGCITSGTRGMLLRAIAAAKDPSNVLMVATDGILATEKLRLPKPVDTGTFEAARLADKQPLGAWEVKESTKGVMLCRPGIYFPLGAGETEMKEVRSRGMARATVLKHADRIVEHFETKGWQVPYEVGGLTRFIGIKQGVRRHPTTKEVIRSGDYGQWSAWPMFVSFGPRPKRDRVRKDLTLECVERMPFESSPYSKGVIDPESQALRELTLALEDQPDGDFAVEKEGWT